MTADELEALVLGAKSGWDVQRACAPLNEKERKGLSSVAQKLHRQLYRSKAEPGASERLKSFIAGRTGDRWNYFSAAETIQAALAIFALGPLSAVKRPDIYLGDHAVLDRIIRDRRPDWLDDWLAHELERQWGHFPFPLLRGWIRDGLCSKPEVDGYYVRFAAYLMRTRPYGSSEPIPPLSSQLLADPELLDDVEGLFRVETIAFNTNSWLSAGADENWETWTDALVTLAAEGHFDRERLLGLALEGLTRDLKQNQLAGFHALYKRMSPTRDELLRHQGDYIALLCHPVGHVAKFAIDMLAAVEKAGALDDGRVLAEIQTVFTSAGKGNAAAALKLIGRIISRDKVVTPAALDAVCEALRHVSPEVQGRALDLIEKQAGRLDQPFVDRLRELESFVAASNRDRLTALLSKASCTDVAARVTPEQLRRRRTKPSTADVEQSARGGATPQAEDEPAPSSSYRPLTEADAVDLLRPEGAITPIASIDELLHALLHATELVDSADEVERILDAISRLGSQRPSDLEARTSPLRHRLQQGRTGANGLSVGITQIGGPLLDLVFTWMTGRLHITPVKSGDYYLDEMGFVPVAAHLRAIATRVARGQARPLLSAPTHKGGWIDPLIWIERLRSESDPPQAVAAWMEFRLSLLRLAPDNRAAALAEAETLPHLLRRLARFALGGDEVPTKADRGNYAAWISAARSRAPRADWSAVFAPLGLDDRWPDSLRPARYGWHSSHEAGESQGWRWKTPRLAITVGSAGDDAGAVPRDSVGLVARLGRAMSGDCVTDWTELPTAALVQQKTPGKRNYFFSGDLDTIWVQQWLAYIWPQSLDAAHMKGAQRLVRRMDEDTSNWTPGFGHFQSLFQRGRLWRESGHLLLILGLVGKDADARRLAVDALVEGIDYRLLDPDLFADVMGRLADGQWIKLNRLADSLMTVIQVSTLHAGVVSNTLQTTLPRLDLQQKNAFRVLEVLLEAQAVAKTPLSEEARQALRAVRGSGKVAKIVRQLLSPSNERSAVQS